ncbi:MAG: hypothetical protein OXH72_12760 [Caldilineaceae bacterium]|nr:hypothetical protein [Caldilineaceae bacterium]
MQKTLLTLASGIVGVGLIAALFDYMWAFDGTLNQYHALRGLVWNIGTYTAARVLVWWSGAVTEPAIANDYVSPREAVGERPGLIAPVEGEPHEFDSENPPADRPNTEDRRST